MIFLINSIYIFLFGICNFYHPIHVSVTNMDYIPDQNKITLSFKVFEKDYQLLFEHLYQVNLDFGENGNFKSYQDKTDEYFSGHFKISNNITNSLSHKKTKKDDDSIWFYYEAVIDKEIDQIEISNTIFLDLYFDQKNMLIVNYHQKEKGYLFNLSKTKQIIDLNDF